MKTPARAGLQPRALLRLTLPGPAMRPRTRAAARDMKDGRLHMAGHQTAGHGSNSHMIMSGLRAGETRMAPAEAARILEPARLPPQRRRRGAKAAHHMTKGHAAGGGIEATLMVTPQPAAMSAMTTLLSSHLSGEGGALSASGRSHCATWRSRCPSSERMPRSLLSTSRAICCCILYLRKCTTRCRSSQWRVELVRADYVRPTCNPMA